MKLLLCLVLFVSGLNLQARESSFYGNVDTRTDVTEDWWQASLLSLGYFARGAALQFTQVNNLGYALAATPALWYSFAEDDRLVAHARTKSMPKHIEFTGDLGVALNFPLISIGYYTYARMSGENRYAQFAMEYFATLYITLVESGIMSFVDVHERPNQENLSSWETNFRGDSSFPSGHIVPYSTLFFKTFQFFGPWWSLPPLVLTLWSSQQRVREGRHYVSDVVGAFFLTAFAAEGVRAAAGYDKNHPLYRKWMERKIDVGITTYRGAIGPRLSYQF